MFFRPQFDLFFFLYVYVQHYKLVAQINHELGYKESPPINLRLSWGSCTFWAERGVRACYLHVLHMVETSSYASFSPKFARAQRRTRNDVAFTRASIIEALPARMAQI